MSIGNRREGGEVGEGTPKVKVERAGEGGYCNSGELERELATELEVEVEDIWWNGGLVGWLGRRGGCFSEEWK